MMIKPEKNLLASIICRMEGAGDLTLLVIRAVTHIHNVELRV